MCAGRCAAYVSLSQFITPSGLQRIWQTANMVQKLIYFLKLIHPRHLFNDQQLSRQSFTVKSNQSGHNTRSFLFIFLLFLTSKRTKATSIMNSGWVSTSLHGAGQVFVSPLQKKGLPDLIQNSFQGSILKIRAKGTIIRGLGNRKPLFLTLVHATTFVLALPHTPASVCFSLQQNNRLRSFKWRH